MSISTAQLPVFFAPKLLPSVLLFCLIGLLSSCQEEEVIPLPSTQKSFTNFSFLAANNPGFLSEDWSYVIHENHVNAMFPPGLRTDSLVASFSSTAAAVLTDTVVQRSDTTVNDFTTPTVYTLMAEDSSTATYEIRSHLFTGVPVVYIDTEGQAPIASKDEYIDGRITIIANGQGEENVSGADIEIRGRGNTTWKMSKKPYRFRFSERTEVLGMPEHKVWILLANFSDKTLLRNHTAFQLSQRFGLVYTPRSQFVDLWLNGAYQGNYQLTEQIKIDESRLNIDELKADDVSNDKITGGYLLEIDGRRDEDASFRTTQGERFVIKSPDEDVPEQTAYIRQYVQAAEDALFADSFTDAQQGYAQYLDTESFVDWYLLNELTKNTDAKFANSVYVHKPRGGKLTMGPVWDYDIGMGNVDYSPGQFTEGWYIREASWIKRLFEDPAFAQRVAARWQVLKPQVDQVIADIDQEAAYLHQSQQLNFRRWTILGYKVWPNPVATGSYAGEVAYLKDWLTKRVAWMDSQLL